MQQLQGLGAVWCIGNAPFIIWWNRIGNLQPKHVWQNTSETQFSQEWALFRERWSVGWDLPTSERNTAHNYNLTHNLFLHRFAFQIKIQAGLISGYMLDSITISGVTRMPKPILWCQVTNEQHYILQIESWFCFHRKQFMILCCRTPYP